MGDSQGVGSRVGSQRRVLLGSPDAVEFSPEVVRRIPTLFCAGHTTVLNRLAHDSPNSMGDGASVRTLQFFQQTWSVGRPEPGVEGPERAFVVRLVVSGDP